MRTHCRCCRSLLGLRESGPLCPRCASGRCRRGRVHRVAVTVPAVVPVATPNQPKTTQRQPTR